MHGRCVRSFGCQNSHGSVVPVGAGQPASGGVRLPPLHPCNSYAVRDTGQSKRTVVLTPCKFLDTHTHTHTHTHTNTFSLSLCLPNMLDPKHMCTHVKAVWPNLGEGSCVDTDVPKKPHYRNHEAEKGGPSPWARRDAQSLELR